MNDEDFLNGLGYISYKKLQNRRRYINRKKSCLLLYNRIKDPLGFDFPNEIDTFIDMLNNVRSDYTFQELFLYIGNTLLGDNYSVYDYTHYCKRKHMIIMDYVSQGSFYGGLNLNEEYKLYRNKRVCATYRLSVCKKKYLKNHAPLAKALIY